MRFFKFMQGRYGNDNFNRFLYMLALGIFVISFILRFFTVVGYYLYYLAGALIVYNFFRMFSKNIEARRRENDAYLKFRYKISKFFGNRFANSGKKNFSKDKNVINYDDLYHIYKCPKCGQKIRIPKGRGKILITCPKCKWQFVKRS